MEQRLATLLHVSDLHFGDPDPIGDSVVTAKAPAWWRWLPHFEGLLGHHRLALEHLDDFASSLSNEAPIVVVTGDLTTCGHARQFSLVRRFLTGSIRVDRYTSLGLQAAGAMRRSVAGNHDHWPGTLRVLGGPSAALARALPATPRVERFPLGNGKTLVFVCINSDAEVRPHGLRRLLARGHCVAELQAASSKLGPPRDDEIRVAVLHHSRTYSQRVPQPRKLSLSGASLRALNEFVRVHGISMLLSGHLHMPDVTRFPTFEARCGTTTVREDLPPTWGVDAPKNGLPPNTLLVHRLVDVDGNLEWQVHRHQRFLQGFRPYRVDVLRL